MEQKRRPFIDREDLARARFVARLFDQLQTRSGRLADRLDNSFDRASGDIDGLVTMLIDGLSDPDVQVRRDAASGLRLPGVDAEGCEGKIAESCGVAVPALTGALADSDAQVRRQILRALGCFLPFASEDVIDVLSQTTEDPAQEVRSAAVATLEVPGSRFPLPAARALARVIAAPGVHDEELLQQAIEGLRACRPDAASDAVGALAERLQDARTPSAVRIAVCDVLAWLGQDARRAADALAELVLGQGAGRTDTDVRVAAARALIQVEYLPELLAGRSVPEDRREQILSLLRQVGSDATAARRALESAWQEAQTPVAPATDSSSPAGAIADSSTGATPNRLAAMESSIAEMHKLLKSQQAGSVEKDWYSVDEVAKLTEFSEWTIRNACNKGRIAAEKGPDGHWRIARRELAKIQNHGLPKQIDVE